LTQPGTICSRVSQAWPQMLHFRIRSTVSASVCRVVVVWMRLAWQAGHFMPEGLQSP
jgi:hypothetical protein